MENGNDTVKAAIAGNITDLRKKSGMTQQDLADALSYTDKAVSKWERAESIPDVLILKRIADLFGVTVDYLLTSHRDDPASVPLPPSHRRHKHALIMGISILLVWLVATFAFVVVTSAESPFGAKWLIFLYAVPVSAVVWLVFNSVWFNAKINYIAISLLLWTVLASVHLTALNEFAIQIWMIYLLGIPSQAIILFWSGIGRRPRRKAKKEPRAPKEAKPAKEPKTPEEKGNPEKDPDQDPSV